MLNRLLLVLALGWGILGSAGAATVNVYIYNFSFSTDATHATVQSPTIHVGDTIHWINDNGFHCTTACTGLAESWSSGAMTVGQTFDHTFTTPGVYNYYCCIHGSDNGDGTATGMTGTITVLPPSQVSGTLTLLNYAGPMPSVTVEIRNPGSTVPLNTLTVVPAADGSFAFTAPTAGTYDIAFKASHWLRRVVANVVVDSNGAAGVNASLLNGDVNGDNVISIGDFNQLRSAFGSTSASGNWNPNADLNGDGNVSIGDFNILRSNFGASGNP